MTSSSILTPAQAAERASRFFIGETVVAIHSGRRGVVERIAPFDRVMVKWENDDEYLYVMREVDLRSVGGA